jgi:hypothetical protein
VLHDTLSVSKFLSDETGSSEHGETAVLKLFGLHDLEFLGVLGAKSERIETDVTGNVIGAEGELVLSLEIGGGDPSDLSAVDLRSSDGQDEDLPERLGNLGEVVDRGAGDLGVEEEGGSLDLLADEETDEREHGYATVG